MKGLSRLMGLLATDAADAADGVPVSGLQAVRLTGMDAYELVDRLARGPARTAAWKPTRSKPTATSSSPAA